MTFAYWMLIAAAMMPYLTTALAKSAGGIDNRAPRPSCRGVRGGADARSADRIDRLAGIFVLLRVIYTALYVADQATLRSIVWSPGLIAVLWLFVLGVWSRDGASRPDTVHCSLMLPIAVALGFSDVSI